MKRSYIYYILYIIYYILCSSNNETFFFSTTCKNVRMERKHILPLHKLISRCNITLGKNLTTQLKTMKVIDPHVCSSISMAIKNGYKNKAELVWSKRHKRLYYLDTKTPFLDLPESILKQLEHSLSKLHQKGTVRNDDVITPKDLSMHEQFHQFLQDIKISSRPAEMIVYDKKTIPPKIFNQLCILIQQHGGKYDPKHVLTSPSTSIFLFTKMKDANAVLDKIQSLFPSITADVSYAP